MSRTLLAVIFFVTATGCVTNREHARIEPGRDIQTSDVFFVERTDDERRDLGQLIADNLSARGMTAKLGNGGSMPHETTILVTYKDRWSWDITMFLIEMSITLRDPLTREAFAIGTSYHTSMSRLNPVEMVEEIISNLIAADNDPDGVYETEDSGAL